jgi:S1-C subfamily serine protease
MDDTDEGDRVIAIGHPFDLKYTATQGIISSLLIPSEALWKRAANEMTSPLVRELGFSPFTSNSVPSVAMIVYAGFYLAAALWFAIRRFQARDL